MSARKIITYGLFFLCAYAAWARGGTYPPLQWPLLFISILLCASPLLLEKERLLAFWGRLRKDPLFRLGAGLLLLLIFQWTNSNYWVVLNESGGAEMLRTPSRWIPWSVDRAEAGEMLVWFFPVGVGVLLIRNLLHKNHLKTIFCLLAINSALLAGVGLFLNAIDSDRVLGIWEQKHTTFFASFSYANHGAQWFYLNAFLSIGLAHDALSKKRPFIQVVVWTVVFFLCVMAIFMTLSRFGALIALTLLVFYTGLFLKYALARVHKVHSVNIYIFSGIVALVGIALYFGVGEGRLADEISQKAVIGDVSILNDVEGRMDQMPLAWNIIRDYPAFGAGGWSYRWLSKIYLPQAEWGILARAGKANVHCDPLQFLSEFGFLGVSLLASFFGIVLHGVLQLIRTEKLPVWIFAGSVVILLHSLIDLPFRCPAVVLQLMFMLAAVPRLSGYTYKNELISGVRRTHTQEGLG